MTTALERGEWSASRPGRSLLPGKTRYPLYRRLGGPQGRSGQVRKISPPTGIRSPDRPARRQSLYRLRYPSHTQKLCLPVYYGLIIFVFHRNRTRARFRAVPSATPTPVLSGSMSRTTQLRNKCRCARRYKLHLFMLLSVFRDRFTAYFRVISPQSAREYLLSFFRWDTPFVFPIINIIYRGAGKSLARPDWKKTIESWPYFVRRGGHCCHGDLVGRTTFWIVFEWLAKYRVWSL